MSGGGIAPLPSAACLGLVAPAGPPKPGAMGQALGMLETLGLHAKVFPSCTAAPHLEHLAASDAQRAEDLHAAFEDPGVDAVLCVRGGYGCLRLLDRLDFPRIQRHAKPLIGYSDITSLHVALAPLGLACWHAPMPCSDWVKPGGEVDALRLITQLRRGLRPGDTLAPGPASPHPLSVGDGATGPLIGGNLTVLASGLCTRWAVQARGAILFLEDVAEEPYRVDRCMAQLRYAGVLDAAAGFLIGSFSDAPDPTSVLADYLLPLGKPILAGWPSGHGQPNWALPLGVRTHMDVVGRALRF